jgi:predicted nucleotidyltransferase
MTPREKHIFQMITRRIQELDPGAEVILYGSHASGLAHPDSDWDILVLLDREDVTLKTEQEFRHHIFDFELEIGEPISIYVRSKSTWESKYKFTSLYRSVQSEGIRL